MKTRTEILERVGERLGVEHDPLLSLREIAADLNISRATLHRPGGPRHELAIVQVSAKRVGVRRSEYLRWKASRETRPQKAG